MIKAVPDILARIVDQKRQDLASRSLTREALVDQASVQQRRDFKAALIRSGPAIIAEIKQASPSKGIFTDAFHPREIAVDYANYGAACLSVLTDEQHFRGSLADMQNARSAVSIPVLRKDFTISEYHVLEAAAHGADAILLIAAILSEREMRNWRELANSYGMAALVEVHDADELETAKSSGADIIGVNNRNLHTFEVTLDTSLRLAEKMPANTISVAESGIRSRADIDRLSQAGYRAFLIGEHLMLSANRGQALAELLQ